MILPKDASAKAIREFFEQQKHQVCSLADCLEEPWKGHFEGLKREYDSALETLPPTDQAPAAIEANKYLQAFASMLMHTSGLNQMMSAHMTNMKRQHETAFNSAVATAVAEQVSKGELVKKEAVAVAVDAEIKKRTGEAGDLVPKETHTQLCSVARETALKEGRELAEAEFKKQQEAAKLVETRKSALATNGFPLPEADLDNILALPDADYQALETTAKSRFEALKGKGLNLNSATKVFGKVWLAKDEEWKAFESLVDSLPKGAPAEPLAGAGAGAPKADGAKRLRMIV